MPLRKLQEIIVDYAQHLYKTARNLARSFQIEYPYQGPAFAFLLEGDRLKFTDNTQVPVTLPDGRVVMENIIPGRFELPERNKIHAAFLLLEHWQNKVLENRNHADPEALERELEIISGNMLSLAVKLLKYTAESYSMPDPISEKLEDYWMHLPFDLSCRSGLMEAGDRTPATIQLKVAELNDLLQEEERRLKRARTIESHLDWSGTPEISKQIIRHIMQELFMGCAGEMVLAGQRGVPFTNGNTQNPPLAIAKDGKDSLMATGSLPRLQAGFIASTIAEGAQPYSHRRKEQGSPRKTNTARDKIASERRKAVEAYIDEVFQKTRKRITKTDFWKAAGYNDRGEFQRWQRNDPKTTKRANERFTRVLREKPHLR